MGETYVGARLPSSHQESIFGGSMSLRLSELARLMREKRGSVGVRAAAAEVGISSATFSRIENGHMPDLESFAKVCAWLKVNPSEFLGTPVKQEPLSAAAVHFKKDRATRPETAAALANLIVVAEQALRARAALTE
ncbi:helix-turn-helix domain-containing protein [Sphingomonas sp. ID1715]|uniref:helix-turn-helix domain-containing protein n=1 Tax=Sphingomonas sp. ID1715 TaxID=1656898 RepID=UPI0034A05A40